MQNNGINAVIASYFQQSTLLCLKLSWFWMKRENHEMWNFFQRVEMKPFKEYHEGFFLSCLEESWVFYCKMEGGNYSWKKSFGGQKSVSGQLTGKQGTRNLMAFRLSLTETKSKVFVNFLTFYSSEFSQEVLFFKIYEFFVQKLLTLTAFF